MKLSFPYTAQNGRKYRFLRMATLDGYIWIEFEDSKGTECMIYNTDNIAPNSHVHPLFQNILNNSL